MTDIQEIKKDQKDIKDDLKRLLFYVENDPKTGKKGIVTEVEDLKTSQEDLRFTVINFVAEYRQAQAVKARDQKWGVVIFSSLTTGCILLAKALVSLLFK